jgi:hypothetical protein
MVALLFISSALLAAPVREVPAFEAQGEEAPAAPPGGGEAGVMSAVDVPAVGEEAVVVAVGVSRIPDAYSQSVWFDGDLIGQFSATVQRHIRGPWSIEARGTYTPDTRMGRVSTLTVRGRPK